MKYSSALAAANYDRLARKFFGREKLAKQISDEFLKYLNINHEPAFVVECAAGSGIITERLQSAGFKVLALDLNLEPLKIINDKFPNVKIEQNNINNSLPVALNNVDGMLAVAADRYMTILGQKNFVTEANRVLKSNGILIWPTFLGDSVLGRIKYGNKWRFGSKEKIKLLKENQFEILSNRLKINGWLEPAWCRLLIAKKIPD